MRRRLPAVLSTVQHRVTVVRTDVGQRLKQAREEIGLSQQGMAESLGLSLKGWQNIELGKNIPSGETLLRIAEQGFNPAWVLTGSGPHRIELIGLPGGRQFDRELLGRVTDAIAKLYKAEGVHLPDVDLGRMSADKYQEIIDSGVLPEDYPAALAMAVAGLRKQLRDATANPASDKRRAFE